MSGALTGLIVVAVAAGLAYAIMRANASMKRARAEEAVTVQAHARARGWRVETPDSGDIRYRLHGRTLEGVAWTLAFDSDQSSSSSSPKLVWRAEGLKAARTELMIGSRKQWAGFGLPATKRLFAGARWLLGGISATVMDMGEFVEQATVSPYGSPAFCEHFVVAARTPAMARAVPERLEGLLLRWPREAGSKFDAGRSVSIWFNAAGLEVNCKIDAPAPPVLDHVVAIGAALADALRAVR
jgi:hypothetical protein